MKNEFHFLKYFFCPKISQNLTFGKSVEGRRGGGGNGGKKNLFELRIKLLLLIIKINYIIIT